MTSNLQFEQIKICLLTFEQFLKGNIKKGGHHFIMSQDFPCWNHLYSKEIICRNSKFSIDMYPRNKIHLVELQLT